MKLNRGIAILSKLRIYAPKSVVKSAYYASITPHIDSGLINWGNEPKTVIAPLTKMFEKGYIYFKQYRY